MAVDEFLLRQPKGLFVRLYQWKPAAVSIGFGQNPGRELDMDKLKCDGIDFVRRMTGGRALMHHKALTYAVAGDVGGIFGTSLGSTYKKISQALVNALSLLGIAAALEHRTPFDPRGRHGASPPCFLSTSRFEVTIDGKKLIGSAQKRLRNRFLQHGSIVLEAGMPLTDYLNLPFDQKVKFRAQITAAATSLEEVLPPLFNLQKIREAFWVGFSKMLNQSAIPLSPAFLKDPLLEELNEKYASDAWNFAA